MLSGNASGGNVNNFLENCSALDSTCSVGKLSIVEDSAEMYCLRDDDSFKCLDAGEFSGTGTAVNNYESFGVHNITRARNEGEDTRVNIEEASLPWNDQREHTFEDDSLGFSSLGDEEVMPKESDCFNTTFYNFTHSVPFQGGGAESNVGKETSTQRHAKSCAKAASKKVLLDLSSLQFARRKRSSLRKQARSTEWGCLRFVPPLLDQNTTIDTSPEKTRRSRKSRVTDKGKQGKNRKHNSIKLIHKRCTPTGPISLKVRIGKETISPSLGYAIHSNKEDSQAGKDLSKGELPGILGFQPCGGYSEKESGMLLVNAEISGTNGKSFNDLKESLTVGQVDGGVVTDETRELDLGTSPDSEVINQTPDAQSSEKDPETLCHPLSSCDMHLGSRNALSLILPCKSTGKEKREFEQGYVKCEVPCLESLNAVQEFPEAAQKDKVGDVSYYSDASTSTAENESLNRSNRRHFEDPMHGSDVAEQALSCAKIKAESQLEVNLSPSVLNQESLESNLYKAVPPCSEEKKLSKSYRASNQRMSDSSGTPNSSSKRDKKSKSSSKEKSSGKSKRKDKKDVDQIHKKLDNESEPGIYAMSGIKEPEEAGIENKCVTNNTIQKVIESSEVMRECASPSAWASCDDCEKWRRIPVVLADRINETKCRWVCKDNVDKDFADCSIPQEKSNAEINAELEISDASGDEGARDFPLNSSKASQKQLTVAQQPAFTLIKSNAFLHRRRKNQPIDEIMVCHCKPPSDGRPGCGDGCLNRVLNIECIQGTCPCFDSCSNQKFQKRKYAKLKSLRCGKKGFGLQLLHDVSEGEFLIEYVGEVLDMHAYEARQKEYALLGHRHFYFMTLNGSEVIDACAKGNLGRFINHSCEPNCRTEKWHVNGEVCIGIFALRDIKKGEEVTFDYNYVRVFGAAAKKCVCGSSQCRGYIGGDPLNAEDIVQGDSDDDYPEPVMIREHSNTNKNPGKVTSRTKISGALAIKPMKDIVEVDDQMVGAESISQQLKVSPEKHATDMSHRVIINIEGSSAVTLPSEITKESRDSSRYSDGQPTVQIVETSSPSDDIRSDSISATPEECSVVEKHVREDGKVPLKFDRSTKITKKPSSVKKSKPQTDAVDVNKAPETVNKVRIPPFNHKRLLEAISSGRFEAVQEKLNQLLDHDGGISKRKDASRGYLKLLLLTATSDGRDHNGAIQSNRDLSMILDALLKTRSKTVLVDIINKNGLQMLHNMLKRYRKEFSKIPILRKLLKVLEYLATREIITSEHINWGPRPGVESLKVSMLKFTEHADKQVHHIARNFRDRWIPRSFRKRDESRMDFHNNSSHDRKSALHSSWNDSAGVPSEITECAAKPVVTMNDSKIPTGSSVSQGTRKRKSRWDQPGNEISDMGTEIQQVDGVQMDEDVPPGFASPMQRPLLPHDVYSANKKERLGHSKHPYGVSIGHPQQRFNSRLSVSYGVPLPTVQQFGIRQGETSENWIVAPGMPFQPFPPLPSYPRDKQKHPEGQAVLKAEQDSNSWAAPDLSQHPPTTSGSTVGMDLDAPNRLNFQRVRSPENLSRKYFRQQKWNNSMIADHQTPMKNAWGPNGHDPRNEMCQGNIGSVPINYNGSYRSENISSSVQSGPTFHPYANQLN